MPSGRPVYVTTGKNADLYVRLNNSTRLLNTAEAVEYIGAHCVATIDAASIDTGDERRDEHLRSPEFLDVAHHPTIQFHSTSIVPTGDRWHVEGELTIRGVTRGVVLDVEYHGTGRDLWGATRAGFTATATINRKDFGLTWDAVLEGGGVVVGDKVEVTLEIQAAKQ